MKSMSRKTIAVGGEYVAKKVHQVISILEAHGWRKVRQHGSHRQFRHPNSSFVATVAGKRGDTMTVGQLTDIRRKSGLKELR
jgi:predicted RNA binding protein YcfA (HicA-like mRNA interferase family)